MREASVNFECWMVQGRRRPHRDITGTNDDAPSRHFNISCPRMQGRRRTRWVTTRYERRRPPTAVSRSRGAGCKTDAVHIGPSPGTNDEAHAAAWVDELDRACLRGDARHHKALSLRSSQPANQHAPPVTNCPCHEGSQYRAHRDYDTLRLIASCILSNEPSESTSANEMRFPSVL